MKTMNSKTKKTTLMLLVGALLLLPALPAISQSAEGNLYVLLADHLQIIDPQGGRVLAAIELDDAPTAIYPTPGGKFIFVTHRGSNRLSAIDFETQRVERTIALPPDSEPTGLYFSPRGENLYATYADDATVALFTHKRASFTPLEQLDLGAGERRTIVFNRRGTRLYLPDEQGLTFYLRKTYEPFRSVRRTEHVDVWAIDPDFRSLWGVGGQGAVVVDERRVRVRKRISGNYVAVEPQFAQRAGRAYLLADGGRRIESYNLRTNKLVATLELPQPAVDITIDNDERLWVIDGSGGLYSSDAQLERLQSVTNLGARPLDLDYVQLQSGEGFACF